MSPSYQEVADKLREGYRVDAYCGYRLKDNRDRRARALHAVQDLLGAPITMIIPSPNDRDLVRFILIENGVTNAEMSKFLKKD